MTQPVQTRSKGPSVQDLYRAEAAKGENIPAVLLEESYVPLPTGTVPIDVYLSADYHRREVEQMWSRVWQMACREEEVAEAGDYVVYEIADYSVVIVRGADDEIRAFHNACLHRGTQLCERDGHAPSLKCTFHGWTYNLEGQLTTVPAKWDFPDVDRKDFCLPQAKVETWEGFVFVNMDPDAKPLAEYLGVLPDHFQAWPHKDRFKAVHVGAVVPLNWKAALEAFLEGYHGSTTHPTTATWAADENAQYDIYGDNVSRSITPLCVKSAALTKSIDEQTIAEISARELGLADPASIKVPDGSTAREVLAEVQRQNMSASLGIDMSEVSTTEILDPKQYFLFPNFFPWGGYAAPLGYRFRPNSPDPQSCIVEVFVFAPLPPGVERPPPAQIQWIDSCDFVDAPGLGALAPIFNQDVINLRKLGRGMRARSVSPGRREVVLSEYQEIRIRQFHQTLDKYLGAP